MQNTYRTIEEVASLYVEPSIGSFTGYFDTEAIAREIAEYDGYTFAVRDMDDDEYWEIVKRHEINVVKYRTIWTVAEGYSNYRRVGDSVEYDMPDGSCCEHFYNREDALKYYAKRIDVEYMRKSWGVEWSCGNRINSNLVFVVSLSEDVEEWDEDSGEWVYDHNESFKHVAYDYECYDQWRNSN